MEDSFIVDTIRSIRRRASAQDGSALILALLTLLMLSVLGMAMVNLGATETTIAGNWRTYTAAFYGAEAGVESGIVGLRALLATTPTPTTGQLNAVAPPSLNNSQLGFVTSSCSTSNPCYGITQPVAPYQASMPVGPYGGLSGIMTNFLIVSPVQNTTNGTRSVLSQNFMYTQVPLFQFAVFYGKGVDLEISPGANMTLNGRVFANSNIYLAPQCGSTGCLKIGSSGPGFPAMLATAGNIYRTIKRDGTEGFGANPQIMDPSGNYQTLNFDHVQNQDFASAWTPAQWQSAALSQFGGTVKDSSMGVTQIIPPIPELFYNPSNPDQVAHQMIELPQVSDSTALASAKMYAQAGLRILVDGAGVMSATDQNGNAVTLPSRHRHDDQDVLRRPRAEHDEGHRRSTSARFRPTRPPGSSREGYCNGDKGVLYVAYSSGGPSATCPRNTRTSANPCPAVRLTNGARAPVPRAHGGVAESRLHPGRLQHGADRRLIAHRTQQPSAGRRHGRCRHGALRSLARFQ